MRVKPAVRYFLNDYKKSLIIFYGVLVALFLIQLLLASLLHSSGSSGGMEFASTILLFVVGMNAFKAPFRLFLQNGLSRKTLYVGFIASLFILAVFMTLADLVLGWFRGLFVPYTSMYMERFGSLYGDGKSLAALLDGIVWSVLSFVTAGMTGLMITSLYYRLSKAWKLIVSIGIPALVFIVIPLIDGLYTKGAITALFINVAAFAFGADISLKPVNSLFDLLRQLDQFEGGIKMYPYRAVLFSVLSSVVTGAFSFLLIRRATVKE